MGVAESNVILAALIDATGTIWSILLFKTVFMVLIIVPYYAMRGVKERWERWDGMFALSAITLAYLVVVTTSIFHTVLHYI